MKTIINVLIAVIFFTGTITAQLGSEGAFDAKNIGMGKTYNAVAKGVYSIGTNPANLASYTPISIEIATAIPLPGVTVKGGTNFLSFGDFKYFFGGDNGQARYLGEADKKRLMDLFSNEGAVSANGSINLLMLGIDLGADLGTFAFSINDVFAANAVIPKGVPEIALYGNAAGKTFDFSTFEAKSWYLRSIALSYARRLFVSTSYPYDIFTIGASVKFIQGISYAGTGAVQATFSTGSSNEISGTTNWKAYTAFSSNFGVKYDFDPVKKESNFSLFPDPAGNGTGYDIGLAAFFGNKWRFSFAITDIGKITWNKNAALFYGNGSVYIDDLTSEAQRDTAKNRITGKSQKIDSFVTDLPTALRAGVSYYLFNNLMVAMDYNLGFNDMPGNSKKARISFGLEWDPLDWIPYIRSGISLGGLYGFNWSMGLGFDWDFLELNIATGDFGSIMAPNSAKYISVAFDTKWKF